MSLVSFYVAATVVTLIQTLRLHDRRLFPLLFFFALLAVAHSQPDWYAARPWHLAAGLSGLALLAVLSRRHAPGR